MSNVEANAQLLQVTYDYTFAAMLRKPFSIFAGVLFVFAAAWGIGNLDMGIGRK